MNDLSEDLCTKLKEEIPKCKIIVEPLAGCWFLTKNVARVLFQT